MKFNLSASTKTEIKRDLSVFLGALLATGIIDNAHPTRAAVTAALITALKVTARSVFPHNEEV